MSISLEVDCLAEVRDQVPDRAGWQSAADAAFAVASQHAQLFSDARIVAVRVVGEAESAALNGEWRDKSGATNVLAFPAPPTLFALQDEQASAGDLVICAPVVNREAEGQNKPCVNHWMHMIVHGVLHLLGHDHVDNDEAEVMESLERRALKQVGVPDPY